MTGKRAHRQKLDDPLVPVSGEHVRAVLQWEKLSEREAVQKLRRRGVLTAQPTLDNIIRGRQVRCRRSLRDGIASLFRAALPSEWLDGKHDLEVWGAARTHADLNRRAGPDSPLGRAGRKLREQSGLPKRDPGPPLYELIAYRFVKDLCKAGADEALARRVLRPLLSLATWQHWFVGAAGVGIIEDTDMDEFAAAVGEALSIALRPWLHGTASVRAGVLEQMARALEAVKDDVDGAGRRWEKETQRAHAGQRPGGDAEYPGEAPQRFGRRVAEPEAKRAKRRPRPPRR
jgi:hypothetical protein